mmetsp:Transcript_7704/g.18664  ORF Transcript_7704/g.18664 Transcript_7704/m.18664 type:complete len:203 (+) Transcript_7704:256-864(+)
MAYVDILAVECADPVAKFADDLKFTITFQCKTKPQEDLEWRITWVGSAKSEDHDQVLDEVLVPPELGVNAFEFVVDGPDVSKIPGGDMLGVTVVMVQALYKGREFVRVGYYVTVEYEDEKLREDPPDVDRPDPALLQRNILHTEPRVTRYLIEWDDAGNTLPSAMPQSVPSAEVIPGMQSAGAGAEGGSSSSIAAMQPTATA